MNWTTGAGKSINFFDITQKIKTHNTKVDTLIEQKRYFLARQELLNNDITTTTGHTYLKAPHTADYQDLEGINIVEDEPNRYEDQNFGP